MLNDFYQHKYIQARNSCFSRFSKNKLIILNSVNDFFCYSFFFPPLWRTKNPLTHGNYYLEAKFPFSSEEFFHPCLNQSWQLCFLRLNSLVTICLVSHPKKKKRERENNNVLLENTRCFSGSSLGPTITKRIQLL